MKKIMQDEAHRIPSYQRLHATFECGCSIYNDFWASKDDVPTACQTHSKALSAIQAEKTFGSRPKMSEPKQSFFKVFKN